MKKTKRLIGTVPGLRKLERAMDNAETPKEAAELWFASPLVPDEAKKQAVRACERQLLMALPLRSMTPRKSAMNWYGLCRDFTRRGNA